MPFFTSLPSRLQSALCFVSCDLQSEAAVADLGCVNTCQGCHAAALMLRLVSMHPTHVLLVRQPLTIPSSQLPVGEYLQMDSICDDAGGKFAMLFFDSAWVKQPRNTGNNVVSNCYVKMKGCRMWRKAMCARLLVTHSLGIEDASCKSVGSAELPRKTYKAAPSETWQVTSSLTDTDRCLPWIDATGSLSIATDSQ